MTLDSKRIRSHRRELRENRCTVLSKLIDARTLARFHRRVRKTRFESRNHRVGAEDLLEDAKLLRSLEECLNAPEVLRQIRTITGLRKIQIFGGRVYRMRPAKKHGFSWHTDRARGIPFSSRRLLGISVNLSPEPFEGGEFVIRKKGSRKILRKVHNTGPGNALIFLISARLEHRVAPVRGKKAKLALAGWFCS